MVFVQEICCRHKGSYPSIEKVDIVLSNDGTIVVVGGTNNLSQVLGRAQYSVLPTLTISPLEFKNMLNVYKNRSNARVLL